RRVLDGGIGPRVVVGVGAEGAEVFFFQAEDAIRGGHVTGVQTCALPISSWSATLSASACRWATAVRTRRFSRRSRNTCGRRLARSEERRVGKECRPGVVGEQDRKVVVGREVGAEAELLITD